MNGFDWDEFGPNDWYDTDTFIFDEDSQDMLPVDPELFEPLEWDEPGRMINGTEEDEILSGGNGDDMIDGKAGNDEIRGGFGDDILNGGDGNDEIYGGFGLDIECVGPT